MGFSPAGGAISGADDVAISNPADSQVLTYDSGTQLWRNETAQGGPSEGFVVEADTTGAVDATAAFQSALDNNSVILIPAGTYRLNSKITWTGASRTIRALGPATIIQGHAYGVFEFRGGWDALGSVSSITTTRTNLVEAGESAPPTSDSWVSVLTMGAAVSVAKSDVLKVVADDLIENARPSLYNRLGEYSQAGKTSSGSTVTLSNILIEPYATNIRLARLQDVAFRIEGPITFDTDPAIRDTGGFYQVIKLRSCKYSYIGGGVKFLNSVGRAIGNYGYCSWFDGILFRNQDNRPSLGHYGYGVQDAGWMTRMTNCHGENLRHMYSEGAMNLNSGNSPDYDYYGGGWFAQISDCSGMNCQSQVFDTHGSAYGTEFSNCRAIGSFIGASSGGSGFVSRGRNIVFRDCIADACMVGFGITATNTKVINCSARRSYYQALQISGDTDDGTNITTIKGIEVQGGVFETIDNYIAISIGRNGFNLDVRLKDVTARRLAGMNPTRGWEFTGNGTITATLDDCVADFSGYASATQSIGINLATDTVTLRANRFRFLGTGGVQTGAVIVGSNGAGVGNGATVELLDYEYDHSSIAPTIVTASITKKRYRGRARFGAAWNQDVASSLFNITAAASVSLAGIAERADPVMTVKFTGTNGAVTTGNLPTFADGVRAGQVVKMVNTSSGVVTIPAANVQPAAATAIPVDGCIELTYHGDYWRRSTS